MFIYQNVEQIADIYATINCFNPVPAFYECIKSKNYNAIPPNYYIMTTAMNFSWVIYGLKTQNEVLSTVSLKYSLLFAAFALLSIYFTKQYKKIITLVAVFAIEYVILNMLEQQYLGISCTIVQFISDSFQFEPIVTYHTQYFKVIQIFFYLFKDSGNQKQQFKLYQYQVIDYQWYIKYFMDYDRTQSQ
ncbi:sugar efflux transporter for intercellular exchange protein (macronuclear) [Tetrahymena thermophila SB210]|uniref:Sugar efflux transporter for intercellular exchange protein n=1 Tax=Tetrahymena thermophila (strain SB210) TaxID=312017 RepID=W7X1B3_TETTS|nr:sugar efflux transporter for intercellular exchange protein [Tetrahymena thermophila SB210]EWS71362.1 sugar efflux transporter for intercellular exchange protein [Tetrahymena thermophila SB210]|eukprot:XP_012656095.1 sugar efflux transporter for intercellular exchange protein [Tetrahymena thermophila SB210]